MEEHDEELLKRHLKYNPELKELWDNHLKLEQKLKKLDKKTYLSPEDKLEKKRLQLQKLKGKTKIEAILEKLR